MREFERYQGTDGLGQDDTERDRNRELEVSVEREQDHEDDHDRERTNQQKLRLGLQELAVLASPTEGVAWRQRNCLVHSFLAVSHSTLEVASLDAVLHADVA